MGRIFHIRSPNDPQFRFEWHQETRKVYVIRIGVQPEHAELLAENVSNNATSQFIVNLWLKGYHSKEHELQTIPYFNPVRLQ